MYKFKITIDKTKVSGSHTNFPFLFSQDCTSIPAGFWTHVIDTVTGLDIRFYDTDGTIELKREVVSFSSGGTVEAWVQIPSLSDAADKEIWCQYGGPTVANSTEVWDDISGQGVYHLNNNVLDSTINAYNGSDATTADTTGQINRGRYFDGADIIELPDIPLSSIFSVSLWMKSSDSSGVIKNLFSKGNTSAPYQQFAINYDYSVSGDDLARVSILDGVNTITLLSSTVVTDNVWHHIAVTRSGTSFILYIDGQPEDSATSAMGTDYDNYTLLNLGDWVGGIAYHIGSMDEVEILSQELSSGWVLTEFNNQNDPASFESAGTEVYVPKYRFKITIDKTKVSGSHTNFPFLFSQDCASIPAGFWAHVSNASGLDIRFFDTDGITELKREVVLFSAGTATAEAWVQIPSLSDAADKEIWCQYGGPTVVNSTEVWTDINASGIYHFQNVATNSTGSINGGVTGATQIDTGKIHKAYSFVSGSSNKIDIAKTMHSGAYTIAAWAYVTESDSGYRLIASDGVNKSFFFGIVGHNGEGIFDTGWGVAGFDSSFSLWRAIASGDAYANQLNTWRRVVCTYDQNFKIYVDGILKNTSAMYINIAACGASAGIGYQPSGSSYFGGRLEEVQFYTDAKSIDWIATEYANQNDPATFESAGAEVLVGATEIYSNIDNDYISTGTGSVLSPYNWTQLSAHFAAVDEDTDYYIKGKRSGTDSDLTLYHSIYPTHTNILRLLPWDLATYGPWILDDPTGYIIIGDCRASVVLTVKGLSAKAASIDLRCSSFDGSAIAYKTCWFDTDYLIFAAGAAPASGNSYDLYGCMLNAKQIEWEYGYGASVTDCVFPHSDETDFLMLGAGYTGTPFTTCYFGNALTDIVDEPSTTLGDLNLIDCEAGYDFENPFPSGGDCTVANKELYASWLFNIPNIDHQSRWDDNDYNTGLFGEDRKGYGAFYFLAEAPLNADFSADSTRGKNPLTVNFTDTSTGSPTSWLWNFGDGTTSTTQNPTHIYASPGIYNVSLTVSDGISTDTETKPAYIIVSSRLSQVYVAGTLVLNSYVTATGAITVAPSGTLITVGDELMDTIYSCPSKSLITFNGKSSYITSLYSDVDVYGLITGKGYGFPANSGPGANSTLIDNIGNAVSFYGANHAGLGTAHDIPGDIALREEYYTLTSMEADQRYLLLNYYPTVPTEVAVNIVHGASQIYGIDFYVIGNQLNWRTDPLEPLLSEGDILRVLYLGDSTIRVPAPKRTYGNYEAPTSLGSGSGEAAGGSGVKLVARSGGVTIAGTVDMNGDDGVTTRSGGGAGGSVWISAFKIDGTGTITADGGSASYAYAGGGGGGYITLNYEQANTFSGITSVLGKSGGTEGILWVEPIKPFFWEKFTGTIWNTKWWDGTIAPVVLDNNVAMDTTATDDRDPQVNSLFGISGKGIIADVDFSCGPTEPPYHTSYFKLVVDDRNWVGVARKHDHLFGMYSINGALYQTAQPAALAPTIFRIWKSDTTFSFQYVDSIYGPQTIFSDTISQFERSKFTVRLGTEKDLTDSSTKTETLALTSADIINKYITLSGLPADSSSVAMNVVNGSPQHDGTDYYVVGQRLYWDATSLPAIPNPLESILVKGDQLRVIYAIDYGTSSNDLNVTWDNFKVFSGIMHDIETPESKIYVDSSNGSDANDGRIITPLQNLFVATAWAKNSGTVVLYDGTYNPTEVMGKNLTLMGANGAHPLITTANVQDTTGSNWENSCLTFSDCKGLVKNINMADATVAVSAEETEQLEIRECTILDSSVGISFSGYNKDPMVLRNTIHGTKRAIVLDTQCYDPYVYSNVIYDSTMNIEAHDAHNLIVASNTIDGGSSGVYLDGSSFAQVVSNNLTHLSIGVEVALDSSATLYNNNFFASAFSSSGPIVDVSGNIFTDPKYVGVQDYHIQATSPDRSSGAQRFDQYYLDRDGARRLSEPGYDIGAYEYIDGTAHGSGAYYVGWRGDDYLNNGTADSKYHTLDKAMRNADSSVVIDGGLYDSYFLALKTQNISINSTIVFPLPHNFVMLYVTLSPENITGKFFKLPDYLGGMGQDLKNLSLNVMNGPSLDVQTDFVVSDGRIMWEGKTMDGIVSAGDVIRAIYVVDEGRALNTLRIETRDSQINLGDMAFVSVNGSDSSGTGSASNPYRTIQKALQDSSSSNILVMSGEYELFSGQDNKILVALADRTNMGDVLGRRYLQDLFETPPTLLPNHTIDDSLWNLYSDGSSSAFIQEGYLGLIYDGSNSCGANSVFSITPNFTIGMELRQAIDPICFSVSNADNTAVISYNNSDWTSTLYTGDQTYSCWSNTGIVENLPFTDYICITGDNTTSKSAALTYALDSSNVSVNIIGGPSQEYGTDFYIQDSKIKWDGLGLESDIMVGDILRVIYRARELSDPLQIRMILEDGTLTVKGFVSNYWERLFKRRLLSDSSGPWIASFFMDRTGNVVDRTITSGHGYASRFYVIGQSIEGTDREEPYATKVWRQPIVLYNQAIGNP